MIYPPKRLSIRAKDFLIFKFSLINITAKIKVITGDNKARALPSVKGINFKAKKYINPKNGVCDYLVL